MSDLPTWEVKLAVYGPIKVKDTHSLNILKGISGKDPFYSDIILRSTDFGVEASVTALASDNKLARNAALFFFGQMLDVLVIRIKQPIYLNFTEEHPSGKYDHRTCRLIDREEWIYAFQDSRHLNWCEPTFMRALGWYRKGLYTEDPFDKFLAFWNSIEITATKYHPKTEAAKNGSKSQIWECFKTLWGECNEWPIINGNEKWIDDNYDVRINIAHGTSSITVEAIDKVSSKIEKLEEVAHKFLKDWRNNKIKKPDDLTAFLKWDGKEK
jgi:hypothetical protein